MTLAEQAARRVDLARTIGATPYRWVATPEAEAALIADAPKEAWSSDWDLLHGIPVERGRTRSEWGLDLIVLPRGG